ncbi:hypothetical protein NVV95_13265 [Herbiconiux sp. CPCC 205716]|uniref:Uncharacterized protein n=1 Tax=Herbiconiux gentiana TaxID=2970912 RepID=A0ABT2GH09_9MICO|nr:hypothetical protein [Herbiconiux gentiana]MCS5715514.1 hypothetical protein [Herbiconiux gentiana]
MKRSPVKRMLVATALVGGAVVLGTVASGSTFALLNSSATSPGAVVRSGTAEFTVSTPLTLPTAPLYPGAVASGSAVVTNTGQVPLSVRIAGLSLSGSGTTFSSALTVNVSAITTGTCPAVPTAWQGTFAAAPATDLGVRVAPNGTARICVAVQLPTSAPASAAGAAAAAFTLSIDGKQVP